MRTAFVRNEVQRLIAERPFRPFLLLMKNGDRVVIEHPENIAFDPAAASGVADFYVISGRLRLYSTFEAVTGVTLLDSGGEAGAA
ncbi:MAG: hypothetical protein K2W96_00840 [Gemmataceae bacterium]|nr:hypothetical protein [Gemmataceae bacterium]